MKLLVLGGTGMLGHKLVQAARSRMEVAATVRTLPTGPVADTVFSGVQLIPGVSATDFDTVVRAVAETRPDAVVNCIGIIKQLKEAEDPIISLSVNSLFPHRLAELCRAAGAHLVHVSTDCVFTGNQGGYTEESVPDATDLYGRTKLLGEVAGPGAVTLRTSIIGREMRGGHGLLDWFLRQEGGAIRGFTRAIFSGLTTPALAQVILDLLERHPGISGLYQISSPPISKHDLLLRLRDAFGLEVEIEPYDGYVCDRSLVSDRFYRETGLIRPEWAGMIAKLVADPTPYPSSRVAAHA